MCDSQNLLNFSPTSTFCYVVHILCTISDITISYFVTWPHFVLKNGMQKDEKLSKELWFYSQKFLNKLILEC